MRIAATGISRLLLRDFWFLFQIVGDADSRPLTSKTKFGRVTHDTRMSSVSYGRQGWQGSNLNRLLILPPTHRSSRGLFSIKFELPTYPPTYSKIFKRSLFNQIWTACLSSHLRIDLQDVSFLTDFLTKFLFAFLIYTMLATSLAHRILLDFIIVIAFT
jgi:hypothetical protein